MRIRTTLWTFSAGYFAANIQTQLLTNPLSRIRRRVAETRKVTTEWNAKLKYWCLPEFRCRTHQTHPSTLFSPIFSLAREKIGPPEARQKRPRRNEPPQATSLILCARFFLSKPQTEFAVWVFLCKSAATSQSRLRRASIPTPFVPSGHFPLIGGIGPWEGSLFQRQIIWKRASLVASASGWNWTPSI